MPEARGISFPFRNDSTGFPAADEDIPLIESGIKQILLTELGERLMRPLFGSRLRSFLFESFDDVTAEAIKAETFRAILENSDKVAILDVSVTPEDLDANGRVAKYVVLVLYDRLGRQGQVRVSVGG